MTRDVWLEKQSRTEFWLDKVFRSLRVKFDSQDLSSFHAMVKLWI